MRAHAHVSAHNNVIMYSCKRLNEAVIIRTTPYNIDTTGGFDIKFLQFTQTCIKNMTYQVANIMIKQQNMLFG